jgi:hypothetical protein
MVCPLPQNDRFVELTLQPVGYQWASTILAILATVMGIFPFLFYKYGPRIRARSRYAQELAQLEEDERKRLKFIEARFLGASRAETMTETAGEMTETTSV